MGGACSFDWISDFAREHHAGTESLLALFLAADGRVIAPLRESEGRRGAISLPVRALTAKALALDADAILLAHNHPGGDPRPSTRDIAETRRLERILFPLSIRIADHVIVAGEQRFSFRASGLL